MVATQTVPADALDILYPPNPPEAPERWLVEKKLLTGALTSAGVQSSALTFLTDAWYAGVISRIHLNTFRVETVDPPKDLRQALLDSVTGDSIVGSAVYMLPSMFNHSCDPNIHISWPSNATAKLETLRSIEPDEQLLITYVDASMSCESRRKLLQKAYGFLCYCPRCSDGD